MNNIYMYIGVAALVAAGFLFIGPDIGGLSFGSVSCTYETLEIEGQQFTTLDAFKQAAEENGLPFDELEDQYDFRDPSDGPVQYRATNCGAQEVEPE